MVIVDTAVVPVCMIRVAQTAADLGNLGWHTKQRVLLGLLAEVSVTAAAVLLLLYCYAGVLQMVSIRLVCGHTLRVRIPG